MKYNGGKRASKWRRYLNIILGISNNKPQQRGYTSNGSSGPPVTPRGIAGDRISDEQISTASAYDDSELQYCVR